MTKIALTDQLWLMKSEPDVYGWDDLIAEGEGTWDGVRNHLAARNLRTMAVGDLAFVAFPDRLLARRVPLGEFYDMTPPGARGF